MTSTGGKRALVIGAGLGGLSAAISLAAEGFEVEVFEKNDKVGGKLNVLAKEGFTFDLGPSLIILPHLFRRLFERAGVRFEDYVQFDELQPQLRSFFEDGVYLDLYSEVRQMEAELERLGLDAAGWWRFMEYSRRLYRFAEDAYLEPGNDTVREVIRGRGLWEMYRGADPFSTMHQGVARRVKDPHLVTLFDFFIKYVGSSAYDAPGFMNLLTYSQVGFGSWYVRGGMYALARGCRKLMDEQGVKVHLDAEVVRIDKQDERVTGLVLADGSTHAGDYVVSNMEVIPAYERLLGESGRWLDRYKRRFEPACSGFVAHLGVDRRYPILRHHNFFHSADQKKFWSQVHHDKRLPDDPTVYVVCPTRTDESLAPEGHEIVKLLPHIPYSQDPPFTAEQYAAFKERLYDKMERMGLDNLRDHIVVEDILVPEDIERMYFSNHGAIYGVVTSWKKNFALKAPKQSTRYANLFFTGGSVNPGGGTPMVVLCGQQVASRIAEIERSRIPSSP